MYRHQEELEAHVVHTSYLRSASLVARSCRAVAILASADRDTEERAYVFGKHMGIAYQVY